MYPPIIPGETEVYRQFRKESDRLMLERMLHEFATYRKGQSYQEMYQRLLAEVRDEKTPTYYIGRLLENRTRLHFNKLATV